MGGRKRLRRGSRELGQGPGLWCSHPPPPTSPPLLTAAPSLPADRSCLWSLQLWNDEVDKVSRGSGKKWGGNGVRLACCHRGQVCV